MKKKKKTVRRKKPLELADLVVRTLDDIKAQNVLRLDVRHLTSMTDAMIIASGRSDRHVRAIAQTLVEKCKEAGFEPLGIEGADAGEWVLVDLGDVVVHIMLPKVRDFYSLEKLWDIAPRRSRGELG
jgi:ribosome-associated protein